MVPDFIWLAGDDDGGVVVVCGRCPSDGEVGLAYHCGPGESHAGGLPHFGRTDLAGFLRFIHEHADSHRDWAACPEEPNWGPLEKVLPLDQCGDWMWMSRSAHGHLLIEAYKHRDTRGYLSLDQDGQAWLIEHGDDLRCAPWGCGNGHDCCTDLCVKDHEHIPVPPPTLTRIPLDEALKRAGL